MKRVLFALALLLAPLGRLQAAHALAQKPNVIYILIDELGYFEPSFMGGRNIRTPNLDRMAAEGVRFNNLFAGSSVCAPTRCCLLTGKHSGHTSVRANGGGTPLREGEETIASMLKRHGYATGGFGKWGCGGRDSTGVPEKHGFDVFLGYYDQVHAHSYYPPYLIRNSEEVPLDGNSGVSGKTYSQYVIHAAALAFIREHAKEPFFAYLPYTPPHGNFDIPDDDPAWALYKEQPWPEPARRYAAMVTMIDRQVGEVLALLRDLGLDERTLVFFSGDNGGADYFKSAEYPRGVHVANKNPQTGVEYRGSKGTLYEGGLRIPFIARWPGKIAPGRVSDYLGYFPDVMTTIAEVTGAKAPADLDGLSLVPELLGEAAAGHKQAQHDYLYWEIAGWTAIRQGTWRAVKPAKSKTWELYDLAADPSESKDLASETPEVLAKLTALAAQATEPAREGTFSRTDRHERDRRAKFGKQDEPESAAPKGKAKGKSAALSSSEPSRSRAATTSPVSQNVAPSATSSKKPNFLVVIADDLARNEIGCYGGKNVATPNIDRLAAQGLRFNHAINSMAMCVPMRASTYTGLYPLHNGVTRNHGTTKADRRSVVHYLKACGYRVGLTGKKHATPPAVYPFEDVPGFEPNCVALTAGHTLDGIRAFMTRDAAEPFCLFVCSVLPHAPWTAGDASKFPPDKLALPPHWADTPATRQAFSKYCAEVEVLDRQVGDVVALVDGLKLDANTLVIFSGEQGPQFPRGKWTNYDYGLASAFVARWPGRVKAGATTDAIIQYEDLVPTFVELAGGAQPEGLDGRSFAGVLTGAASAHRDCAFAIHNNVPEGRPYPIRTIRDTRYKLILNLTPDREYHEKHMMDIDRENYWRSWVEAAKADPKAAQALQLFVKRPAVELYDLREDPWELTNLAEKPELAQTRAAMEKRLRDWMAEQGDPGAALDAEINEDTSAKRPGKQGLGAPAKQQKAGAK